MCGRYARYQALSAWLEILEGPDQPDLFVELQARDAGPRYNITPGTKAWIGALAADGRLGIDEHKWSFPTSRGNRINVRSETAHVVPEYREHYDKHRCVVLASGFYEPKGEKGTDRPWFFFRDRDEKPLFLGAIAKAEGFSILTRKPVEPVASIHDRTPVFIPAEDVMPWLDPDVPGREALREFAPPEFGERLVCWQVGDGAKRPGNEGPELIEPISASGGLFE